MNEILLFKLITSVLFLFVAFRFFFIGRKAIKQKKITVPINSVLLIFYKDPKFTGQYAVSLGKLYVASSIVVIAAGLVVIFYLFA